MKQELILIRSKSNKSEETIKRYAHREILK